MSLKNTLKKVRQGIIKTFKAKNVVPVYVQKENNNILDGQNRSDYRRFRNYQKLKRRKAYVFYNKKHSVAHCTSEKI